jgi:hypothetical protein
MKMIKKEVVDGKDVITTESNYFLFKRIRKFEAQEERPRGYWKWLELPDHKMVGHLTFQLDSWNKL